MSERLIRIGRVSSINEKNGMVSVTYPDLDDSTTAKFPVLSFNDEFKELKIGQSVLVLHLSNGQSAGVVLGGYWNESNIPPALSGYRKELGEKQGQAYIDFRDGTVTIHADRIVLDSDDVVSGDIKTKSNVSLVGHVHTDSMGGSTGKAR